MPSLHYGTSRLEYKEEYSKKWKNSRGINYNKNNDENNNNDNSNTNDNVKI